MTRRVAPGSGSDPGLKAYRAAAQAKERAAAKRARRARRRIADRDSTAEGRRWAREYLRVYESARRAGRLPFLRRTQHVRRFRTSSATTWEAV